MSSFIIRHFKEIYLGYSRHCSSWVLCSSWFRALSLELLWFRNLEYLSLYSNWVFFSLIFSFLYSWEWIWYKFIISKIGFFFLLLCSITFALMRGKFLYAALFFLYFGLGKLCGGNSPSLKSHGPLVMLIFTYNVHLAMEEFSLRYSFHISFKSVAFIYVYVYVFVFSIIRKNLSLNRLNSLLYLSALEEKERTVFKIWLL